MKINGKKVEGPTEEVVVLPRAGGDIVFKAKSVLDFTEFDVLCPRPEPPMKMVPGGKSTPMQNSKDFLEKLDHYAELRSTWMILKSLSATPGLEWETVKADEPETWTNFQKEFEETGISPVEASRIMNAVTTACGLDQTKIDEATERFLAGARVLPEDESSQNTELQSMLSGALAKG